MENVRAQESWTQYRNEAVAALARYDEAMATPWVGEPPLARYRTEMAEAWERCKVRLSQP